METEMAPRDSRDSAGELELAVSSPCSCSIDSPSLLPT